MKYPIVTSFILIIIFLHCSFRSAAQDDDSTTLYSSDSAYTPDDSDTFDQTAINPDTTVYRSSFNITHDSVNFYKSNKNFSYILTLDSLLRKRKLAFDTVSLENYKGSGKSKGLGESAPVAYHKVGKSFFDNIFIRVILWIVAFSFIGFIIYKLFLSNGLFSKNPYQKEATSTDEPEENIYPVSGYDKLINEAVNNKNFRLAIRYHYLQTLKKLFDKGSLQYGAEKTNYQYLSELGNPGKKEFSLLTRNYEYIWYGKFDINEELYFKLQNDYKQYQQKI